MSATPKNRRPRIATAIAAGTLALFTAATPGRAQDPQLTQGQWYFSPLGSVIAEDEDRLGDIGYGFQLGVGRMLTEHFAVELNANGGRIEGFNETGLLGSSFDMLAVGNVDGTVAPYALVGVGWLRSQIDEAPSQRFQEDTDNVSLSFGGGALFRLGNFPGSLRTELRVRNDLAENTNLTDVLFSAGLLFPLGARQPAAAPVPLDSDDDGVADTADRCPDSPPGSIVDAQGCELDSDGDGVADRRDRCPGTARGVDVDSTGCELDGDGDGVVDSRDDCPGTPRGTRVGADGCPLDSDQDGVLDADDDCPNTRRGARVDFRGCEIREEIELPGVNFETNDAVLLPSSRATLDGAVATLQRYPSLEVECDGHTDSRGAAEYNQQLSQRRAEAVCEYLEAAGIDGDRLSARGFGESRPIAPNDSPEGRAANRRVTLRVVSD